MWCAGAAKDFRGGIAGGLEVVKEVGMLVGGWSIRSSICGAVAVGRRGRGVNFAGSYWERSVDGLDRMAGRGLT